MNIQSATSSVFQTEQTMATNQIKPPPPPKPPAQDELSDFMNQSRDDEAVQSFMHDIMAMEQSGTFDAEQVAAMAPASLQQYAQENDIDLAEFFQAKHDAFQQRQSTTDDSESSESVATQTYQAVESTQSPQQTLLDKLTGSIGVNTVA